MKLDSQDALLEILRCKRYLPEIYNCFIPLQFLNKLPCFARCYVVVRQFEKVQSFAVPENTHEILGAFITNVISRNTKFDQGFVSLQRFG